MLLAFVCKFCAAALIERDNGVCGYTDFSIKSVLNANFAKLQRKAIWRAQIRASALKWLKKRLKMVSNDQAFRL